MLSDLSFSSVQQSACSCFIKSIGNHRAGEGKDHQEWTGQGIGSSDEERLEVGTGLVFIPFICFEVYSDWVPSSWRLWPQAHEIVVPVFAANTFPANKQTLGIILVLDLAQTRIVGTEKTLLPVWLIGIGLVHISA